MRNMTTSSSNLPEPKDTASTLTPSTGVDSSTVDKKKIPKQDKKSAPPANKKTAQGVAPSKLAKLWISGILVFLLVIVLLVFILQNTQPTQITLFFWELNFPQGVGILLSAVIGGLIAQIISGLRIFWSRKRRK